MLRVKQSALKPTFHKVSELACLRFKVSQSTAKFLGAGKCLQQFRVEYYKCDRRH